jgi:starch synthase
MGKQLKVLFLSPEAVPFAKTGGLGDVAGSLPPALRRLGVDVRVVMPLYTMVKGSGAAMRLICEDLKVPLGDSLLSARIWEAQSAEKTPVYLVEREDLYSRSNLYGTPAGDYYDNLERFSFYSHAALRLAEEISFRPDLIHCHDWQSGLVPALVRDLYRHSPSVGEVRTVFTIHNLGYQGIFSPEKLRLTGLSMDRHYHMEGLEYWGKISLLKAGIMYADMITTVSPTYAQEIQTESYGLGMEGILRRRKSVLFGILNGVDYGIWDPAHDTHLPANYSIRKMAGKSDCKKALISEMGLDPALINRPLLGVISRLDAQKGIDLLVAALPDILARDAGVVILGSGESSIQEALRTAARDNPGRVGLTIGFNDPLAHRIMGGADMFLIPSRYEPCGLTQMYSLRYGTVPVVRATGGLDDTIVPFCRESGEGNGLKFSAYQPQALLSAVRDAVDLFGDAKNWKKLLTNAMKADFSWDRSARSYLELYQSALKPAQTR